MTSFKNTVNVVENSFKNEGDGVVSFPNGLIISDDQTQRSGTRYDIDSLDISKYAGQLTADHKDELKNILGRVEGVEKKDGKLTINKIVYAVKESPYARLAYNLLVNGFSKGFSTETIGPSADNDGTLYSHELVGLSQVVTPNNYSAVVNQVVKNSLKESQEDGFDTEGIENEVLKKEETEMTKQINEITDEQATDLLAKFDRLIEILEEKETKSADESEKDIEDKTVEEIIKEDLDNSAPEKEEEIVEDETTEVVEDDEEEKKEEKMNKEEMKNAFAEVLKGFYANQVEEPKFENSVAVSNDYKKNFEKQINSYFEAKRFGSADAQRELMEINKANLNALKREGIVSNSMTLADLGNFVVSPEMHKEIIGKRTDYTNLLKETSWTEIEGLKYVLTRRIGDIDMKSVALGPNPDGTGNENLKPISVYKTKTETKEMEELASVTPVCDSTTRFFAANLLEDIASGYRNDYDRKRAQLVIARLQEAVTETGQTVQYSQGESVDALVAWLEAISKVSSISTNGKLIFSNKTYAKLFSHAIKAGISGPLGEVFVSGATPTVFGIPYIVVSDDLMPGIESEDDIQHTVEGKKVKIENAVFYAELDQFVGYTNGGLVYDLSTDAAYEEGGVVKSAYQRNEIVLRGSFYRGGGIKDITRVAGIKAATA